MPQDKTADTDRERFAGVGPVKNLSGFEIKPLYGPEDIKGMDASEGILTARGGMTSHAALVLRGRGQ